VAGHDQQGTGKHGHKDTQEPYPHHQGGSQQGHERGGSQGGSQQGGERGGSQSGSQQASGQGEQESLKRREYTDEKGDVHHHTKTYMEQHGKDGGGSR
jgi:hypothetical protein